jgi:hypothetical protein
VPGPPALGPLGWPVVRPISRVHPLVPGGTRPGLGWARSDATPSSCMSRRGSAVSSTRSAGRSTNRATCRCRTGHLVPEDEQLDVVGRVIPHAEHRQPERATRQGVLSTPDPS